jgi:hypothetical protein
MIASYHFHTEHKVLMGGIQLSPEMVNTLSRLTGDKLNSAIKEIRRLYPSIDWETVRPIVDKHLGIPVEEDEAEAAAGEGARGAEAEADAEAEAEDEAAEHYKNAEACLENLVRIF